MADPASELDNLLSGHARIEPYQSADAPDAARLLFGGLPEGDEALAALDRAVWEWLDSQRTGGVPDLDQLPLERWLRKVSEAFEIIALLKLRHTALDLRQRFVVWNSWCDRLAISAQRDGRYAFLRTLALTQRIVADADSAVTPFGLEPLWLQVCEYAGGAYPKHYLAVSLLGLRMLPEREGTPSERPWMTGLVHWTIGQKPTAEEFSQQWWALKGLYPRMPSYWRSALTGTLRQSSVNQIPDELKKWWQQDVARKEGPIAEESEIQSVGVPQLPSRKTHQSLLNRKTVRFNKGGLEKLPEDKPVVYKIVTTGGANNYIGVAKRGRIQDRLSEHLPGGPDAIPGAKVVIEQMDNVADARQKEANMIKRAQPKYNKRGK